MADTPAAATASTAAPGDAGAPYALSTENQLAQTLIFLVLLFFIFYFVLLRPQQQRAKSHARLLETVQKGSRIVTAGGIIGVVTKTEAEGVLQVEIATGVKVRVMRDTVAEVIADGAKGSSGTANDN